MTRRKCPSGASTTIICLLIFVILLFVSHYLYRMSANNPSYLSLSDRPRYPLEHPFRSRFHHNVKMGAQLSNHPRDTLSNPYVPPLRDGNYFPSGHPGIPINIPTRGPRTEWRQIGILTRGNGEETILPLMGRPLYSNRQKWQFYSMSDKNNSVKLPISKNGRSCSADHGCDEIFNGDTVYVEGYNDSFKATVYENNVPEYIPFV
jgi:hypothetical protein